MVGIFRNTLARTFIQAADGMSVRVTNRLREMMAFAAAFEGETVNSFTDRMMEADAESDIIGFRIKLSIHPIRRDGSCGPTLHQLDVTDWWGTVERKGVTNG